MSKKPFFTGPFAPICESYVAQKRASGLDYNQQAKLLRLFDNFCKDYEIQSYTITKEIPVPAKILKDYLAEESQYRQCDIDAPLFCNRSKAPLTRGGVYYIIQKYVSLAQKEKPDLFPVRVHPHVFRHSRAMHWLEAGVDLQYIKDLLGHSDIKTTEVYARLNIKMKQKLLEQVHPQQLSDQQPSWTDDENLMQWLTQLYIPTK